MLVCFHHVVVSKGEVVLRKRIGANILCANVHFPDFLVSNRFRHGLKTILVDSHWQVETLH